MQWLFAIRPVSQVLTVESILGKLRPPEIELSVLNQSGLAAKEFMDGGGTGVEFALDSPFIELRAAEPPEMSKLESAPVEPVRRHSRRERGLRAAPVSRRLTALRAAEPPEMSKLESAPLELEP